jgi:hypothetical protein
MHRATSPRVGETPSLIKPLIIAFAAAFVLLGGAFFVLAMLDPPKPDGVANSQTAAGSSFSDSFLKSFVPAFREGCVKSAQAALTKNGVDLSANGIGAKVEAYCTCATDHTASDLTVEQLMEFQLNPASEPAATKMKDIVKQCQALMGSAGQ